LNKLVNKTYFIQYLFHPERHSWYFITNTKNRVNSFVLLMVMSEAHSVSFWI